MRPILIVYATRHGHTRRVAGHIGATLAARRRPFDVIDARRVPERFFFGKYPAVILIASLHFRRYEAEMIKFAKLNLPASLRVPAAFVSVSLAQKTLDDGVAPPEKVHEANAGLERSMESFFAQSGWRPALTLSVAGALPYTRYDFITRFVMSRISKKEGGPIDTTRDYEFTDWAAVDRFTQNFLGICGENSGVADPEPSEHGEPSRFSQ